MRVEARLYRTGDEKAISDIHYGFRECFEEEYVTPDFIRMCALRPDFDFIVAEIEGTVIGFCGTLYNSGSGRAEIGPVAVAEELQGHGFASMIIAEALEFLKGKGVHRATAIVKEGNEAGIKFFLKNGFAREAVLEKYTRNGESAVQLAFFTSSTNP